MILTFYLCLGTCSFWTFFVIIFSLAGQQNKIIQLSGQTKSLYISNNPQIWNLNIFKSQETCYTKKNCALCVFYVEIPTMVCFKNSILYYFFCTDKILKNDYNSLTSVHSSKNAIWPNDRRITFRKPSPYHRRYIDQMVNNAIWPLPCTNIAQNSSTIGHCLIIKCRMSIRDTTFV